MSDSPVLGLQLMLHHLKEVRNEWFLIGIALGVPLTKLREIEASYTKEGMMRCVLEMVQYWLDTNPAACWEQVIRALEQVDQLTLAATIKQKYLWDQPPAAKKTKPETSLSVATTLSSHELCYQYGGDDHASPNHDVTAEIKADGGVVRQLRDLECELSLMLSELRKLLADCDVSEAQFFFSNLFGTEDFDDCNDIKVLLNKLCRHGYIDTFNVYPLEKVAICLKRDDVNMLVKEYEEKKEKFLKQTTVVEFQRAVVSKAKPALSKGKVEVTIKVQKQFANEKLLKDMEQVAAEAFDDNQRWFVHFHAIPGSVIILWHVPESLCDALEQLALSKAAMLREEGVEELTIRGRTVFSAQKIKEVTKENSQVLQKVYHEFHHQLVDVLSDRDTHNSIVSKLHTRAVISQEVMIAQMNSTGGNDQGSSLLTVLDLEDKPHKLRELITAMMEEENVRPLAEEMTAMMNKTDQDNISTEQDLVKIAQVEKPSVVQEQAAMILQLNTKLKSLYVDLEAANNLLVMRERLISSLLSEKHRMQTELKEMKRRVGDLEMALESIFPSLVKINGEGRKNATAGQMTSIELSVSSKTTSSLSFPLKQLSCQLTDPKIRYVECSITSTQPGMATVSYTPTLRGAHRLKITIGDTDISGSPFTVHVLPSLEMRGVPIKTIGGFNNPWGVAVSGSGEVVVSERSGHCITVYDRNGKKIRKFGSKGSSKGQFNDLHGVAITTDNHILVTERHNYRIQMFTMEGEFEKSVGEFGTKPLQFNCPAGIAVHPSGLVFVVDDYNHRIQVLRPDLSFSHMFGSKGSGPGQFVLPDDVAFDNSGIVYVTDFKNHRVQKFSADGQFISSFGSLGAQPGQLYRPRGICIDSTDTAYVTDDNHRVSVFSRYGKFLKCFGEKVEDEEIRYYPVGMAIDNTTGNLYVCEQNNKRVVVY